MIFKSLDDVERDVNDKERNEFKEKIVKDTTEILGKIKETISKKKPKTPSKKNKILKMLIWLFFGLGLLIFCINFLLVNIWLFKWLIKSLIFG